MRLIALQQDTVVTDVVFDREAAYLGTKDGCRVQLRGHGIADHQALIRPEADGGWLLLQLNDACAVHLNGSVVTESAPLHENDEIQIGDYTVRVHPDFAETTATRQTQAMTQTQLEEFAQAVLPPGSVVRNLKEPLALATTALPAIGRAGQAVSGRSTVEELMDGTLQALLEAFAGQRAWIGIRRANRGPLEYEEGRLLTGRPTDMPSLCKDLRPRVLDRGQFVLVPRISPSERTSVLAGPLRSAEDTLGMLYVDSGESARRYTPRDLDMFMIQAHLFAHQLDAIFRTVARNRASLIEGQVSVAHEIQTRLTPRKLPQWDTLTCSAFRETGRQHTGDTYDVLRLSNDLAAFMIAQTAASGALPSLLIAQAQTAFRVAAMHQDTPAVFLRSLNWILHDGQKDHPLDCFAGVIDPASGKMRYSVAGNVGAFIIGTTGEPRRLAPHKPQPALSLVRSAVYPMLPEQLDSGETLALFTAGVTTAKSPTAEIFGTQRFIDTLCDGFGQPPSAMMKDVITELRSFTHGGTQPDDITVILAHRS